MKILKEPWWVGRRLQCQNAACGASVKLEAEDRKKIKEHRSDNQHDGTYYSVACPKCGEGIHFSQ